MLRDRWLFGRRTRTFTLQWHLTNACPFHCRHCYDRSDRGQLSLEEARKVVADLLAFTRAKRVLPRVSLTGGDPLHCDGFWELYRNLHYRRIQVSILGNPVDEATIRRLLEIGAPRYYQVSLEGLREHNDAIRGRGHFDLVLEFLNNARRLGLNTHVMLTLTRANLEQVIPLGNALRGLTSRFTFNRLAQMGEGEDLPDATPERFATFLENYTRARHHNPVFGFKDNLFNVLRERHGQRRLPGCTGFGCGAAFNFLALLPDGEVHACRKLPSLVGRWGPATLAEIYRSEAAAAFRSGPLACRKCPLRNRCGGCPAVTRSHGLDPLKARDPFCFRSS